MASFSEKRSAGTDGKGAEKQRRNEVKNEDRFCTRACEYCKSHVTPEGEIIGFKGGSMDDMMAGSILVWMYEQTGEACYEKACRRIYEAFADYPRTKEGGFPENMTA